jgi:FAD binding domain-containing protein
MDKSPCVSPGGLRGSIEHFRAFPADAEQNKETAKAKITTPVLALGGDIYPGNFAYSSLQSLATNVTGVTVTLSGHWIPEEAAIEAHEAGANVLIISKVKRGDPHTVLARGGINAALGTMDPEDNWMIHAADTLREGEFLTDYERVEVLCKSAPDSVNELVNWGAKFHR